MNTRCKDFKNEPVLDNRFWEDHLPVCNDCQEWFDEQTRLPEPPVSEEEPVPGYFSKFPERLVNRIYRRQRVTHYQWAVAASILILAGFSWFWLTNRGTDGLSISTDEFAYFYSSEPVFLRPGGLNGDMSDSFWEEVLTGYEEELSIDPAVPAFSDSLFNTWFEETRQRIGGK